MGVCLLDGHDCSVSFSAGRLKAEASFPGYCGVRWGSVGRGLDWASPRWGWAGPAVTVRPDAPATYSQLFPVGRHLLACYIRPPGHSAGKRQLSSIPTWQPRALT